jgi:hypothetical protein
MKGHMLVEPALWPRIWVEVRVFPCKKHGIDAWYDWLN